MDKKQLFRNLYTATRKTVHILDRPMFNKLAALGKTFVEDNHTPLIKQRFKHRCDIIRKHASELIHTNEPLNEEPSSERTFTDAVVMQGPVTDDTADSLRYMRCIYPNALIVLSTWNGTEAKLLRPLKPFCDCIVTSEPPAVAGGRNRNYQIVSTYKGICEAESLGAQYVLKIRTDCCVTAPDVFNLYRTLSKHYDSGILNDTKSAGRIFVNQTYTKKFIPYHVSDIVMLGRISDLKRFWSVQPDNRELSVHDASWAINSLEKIGLEGLLPECYLTRHYAASIGWQIKDSLVDYWRLMRDIFVVQDDSWFDLIWFKLPIPIQPLPVDETVTHAFWQSLYHGLPPKLIDIEVALTGIRDLGVNTLLTTEPISAAFTSKSDLK
ncbi:MAG: hypothetical protein JXX14_24895 [Deltaproteobacteria bacterium]|nr:hypothetical protein [Deltaproteobacteria bacterium]